MRFLLALVAVDLTTKAVLVTPEWAWHPSDHTVLKGAVLALFGLLTAALLSYVAGGLLIAGALGNALSALTGPVANPFVLARLDVAFNMADLYLLTGFSLALVLAVRQMAVAR